MPTALASTPVRRRWLQWQQSRVAQRLLTATARQQGYSVLYVPAPLREAFLDVAHVFRLYDRLFQKPRRTLSSAQRTHLAAWALATQALIAAFTEEKP